MSADGDRAELEPGLPGRGRLASWIRWLLLAGGLGPFFLLAVAGWLQPDPRGVGTHERLGLPPCYWQEVWNIPCPSCGMTTSWSHLVRGNPVGSWAANPAGTTAGLIAVVLGAGLMDSAVRGRWSPLIAAPWFWLATVAAQFLWMLAVWTTRLF